MARLFDRTAPVEYVLEFCGNQRHTVKAKAACGAVQTVGQLPKRLERLRFIDLRSQCGEFGCLCSGAFDIGSASKSQAMLPPGFEALVVSAQFTDAFSLLPPKLGGITAKGPSVAED